jgi:hypothetical protein
MKLFYNRSVKKPPSRSLEGPGKLTFLIGCEMEVF